MLFAGGRTIENQIEFKIQSTKVASAKVAFDTVQFLGPAFGRTDFSRIFIFEPPDFFADFLAGLFLLIFVGKSAQKNPPGKSSTIYTTKILQHISADCPGQQFLRDLREP